MNETKKKILIIIRILLRVILFITTFFMLDMFYTIIYPDRYYIFEVNYLFISLYILTAVEITCITVKLKDFFIYKVKYRSDLFMRLIYFTGMIIFFGKYIIRNNSFMSYSYKYHLQLIGKYTVGQLLMDNMFVYVLIMIDYFCIRSIIRHIPACFKRR